MTNENKIDKIVEKILPIPKTFTYEESFIHRVCQARLKWAIESGILIVASSTEEGVKQ